MKSKRFTIVPITNEVLPGRPAVILDGDQITATQAHAIAQFLAGMLAMPVSLFAPGRRTPSGLYAPNEKR